MYLKSTLLLIASLFFTSLHGQIIKAKPADFKQVRKRILAVEILGEDTKQIKKWEKKAKSPKNKAKFTKMIADHKKMIASTNANIKKSRKSCFH